MSPLSDLVALLDLNREPVVGEHAFRVRRLRGDEEDAPVQRDHRPVFELECGMVFSPPTMSLSYRI